MRPGNRISPALPPFHPMPYFDEPGVRFDDPLVRYDDPRTYQQVLNQQPQHPMFNVAVGISTLTVPNLIDRAKAIRAGIAGQPVFASLAAKLTALDTLIASLVTKQTAIATTQAAATTAVSVRDAAKTNVADALNALGVDVGQLAVTAEDVNATTMHVAGAATPKPQAAAAAPTNLQLTIGDHPGAISGHCNGQPGVTVDYYEIRITTGDPNAPATTWPFTETSTKSSFDMEGLPSGQMIWAEMRACNSHGKSPWSDPATIRVP